MKRRLALLISLAALPLIARAQAPAGPGIATRQPANAPQTRGVKGDQQRHYFFTEAAAEMPYRLYVPQSYDPAKPTPLVVALHGYGGNQDYFFTALEELPELLEQHGFIFAAPDGLLHERLVRRSTRHTRQPSAQQRPTAPAGDTERGGNAARASI